MFRKMLALVAPVMALLAASNASAQANNNPPPANPIFSLTGQAQSVTYVNYSFTFVAAVAATNLTFAMRNDPAFIILDDISMTTGGGANLIVNGGFESGPVGASAPTGWTYLNQYGAAAGGTVQTGCARTGTACYFDGAVQAYDAITQVVATTVGATYSVSFWAGVNTITGTGFYQPLSTNGAASTGGNGIDLFVYATQGAPAPGGVPEPSSWAMMIVGIAATGAVVRRRRVTNALATA